jgi:hypothetical protein
MAAHYVESPRHFRPEPPKISVRVEAFKPLRSNTLFGFADLVIPELCLRVRDATVHQMNGRRWVGLPAKPQINRDGVVRRDARGKILYAAVLQFIDRTAADAFSARVIGALLAEYPHAFADQETTP